MKLYLLQRESMSIAEKIIESKDSRLYNGGNIGLVELLPMDSKSLAIIERHPYEGPEYMWSLSDMAKAAQEILSFVQQATEET